MERPHAGATAKRSLSPANCGGHRPVVRGRQVADTWRCGLGEARDALVDLVGVTPEYASRSVFAPALEQEVGALDERHAALLAAAGNSELHVDLLGQLDPHEVAARRAG